MLHELRALGGASQPADDEQLVAEASDPEHLLPEVDPAALHAKGDALIQAIKELGYYPKVSRNIVCWSKLWDDIGQQEPAVEKLLKDVLYFGRLPHQLKKADYGASASRVPAGAENRCSQETDTACPLGAHRNSLCKCSHRQWHGRG